MVEVPIKHAKTQHEDLEAKETVVKHMLRMTNNDGNTALHEAAKNHNSTDVVKLLMSKDRDFPYESANNYGEMPLYIAVSVGSLEVMVEMLKTCASTNYEGPCGMTILHVVVKRNRPNIIRKILEKKSWTKRRNKNKWSLIKETDENGWTPLHYAAYYGRLLIVKLLLEFDASAACIADKYRKMTALHLAAGQGNFHTVGIIIDSCPACLGLIDDRGWNYVHFTMCSVSICLVFSRRQYFWIKYLLDSKDVRGNTPRLVLSSISQYSFNIIKNRVRKEFIESTMQSIRNQEDQFQQLKNEVLELYKVRDEPYKRGVVHMPCKDYVEIWSSLKKTRDIYLVVNALIATVTFTAGLTLPGGYIQEGPNQGIPILIGNSAFQAFVISDATSMTLSVSAILLHIIWKFNRLKKHLFVMQYAHIFTLWALVAMNVAFLTGTYAMLRPSSGLAITTALVVLSAFPLQFYFSYKRFIAGFDED